MKKRTIFILLAFLIVGLIASVVLVSAFGDKGHGFNSEYKKRFEHSWKAYDHGAWKGVMSAKLKGDYGDMKWLKKGFAEGKCGQGMQGHFGKEFEAGQYKCGMYDPSGKEFGVGQYRCWNYGHFGKGFK